MTRGENRDKDVRNEVMGLGRKDMIWGVFEKGLRQLSKVVDYNNMTVSSVQRTATFPNVMTIPFKNLEVFKFDSKIATSKSYIRGIGP